MKLTEMELAVLNMIELYGGGFDVTSARIGKAIKAAALRSLRLGIYQVVVSPCRSPILAAPR